MNRWEMDAQMERREKALAAWGKVYPSPEVLARHKRAALGLELFAETASSRDVIWYRAKNVVELAERYYWDVPDYIIRAEIRFLRDAIEKWEAEQEV